MFDKDLAGLALMFLAVGISIALVRFAGTFEEPDISVCLEKNTAEQCAELATAMKGRCK